MFPSDFPSASETFRLAQIIGHFRLRSRRRRKRVAAEQERGRASWLDLQFLSPRGQLLGPPRPARVEPYERNAFTAFAHAEGRPDRPRSSLGWALRKVVVGQGRPKPHTLLLGEADEVADDLVAGALGDRRDGSVLPSGSSRRDSPRRAGRRSSSPRRVAPSTRQGPQGRGRRRRWSKASKRRLLVLLEVAVVGQWQALHQDEQSRERPRIHAGRTAADQLEDVGVSSSAAMMLLPVQSLSGRARKENSWVLQMTHLLGPSRRGAQRSSSGTKTDSIRKSRSLDTVHGCFAATPSKPEGRGDLMPVDRQARPGQGRPRRGAAR